MEILVGAAGVLFMYVTKRVISYQLVSPPPFLFPLRSHFPIKEDARWIVIGSRHSGSDTQLFDVSHDHHLSFIVSLAERGPDQNTHWRVTIDICITVITLMFLI